MIKKALFFIAVLFSIFHARTVRQPFFFKSYYPEYIPVNCEFDVSLKGRFFGSDADEIHFYILVDRQIELNEIRFVNTGINSVLEFTPAEYLDYPGNIYKVEFDLNDSRFDYNSIFQLYLSLDSYNIENAEVKFAVDLLQNNEIIDSYFPVEAHSDFLPEINLEFYYPQEIASKSLKLKSGEELKIPIQQEISNMLMTEFWVKINKGNGKFFALFNEESNDTLLTLHLNEFNFISAKNSLEIKSQIDFFIGSNVWNHINIFYDSQKLLTEIFVNDSLVFFFDLFESIKSNNLQAVFFNENSDNVLLDNINLWDFNNSVETALLNKNFVSYTADSSNLFFSYNCDRLLNSSETLPVEYTKSIEFVESDAPIFSKAPDLNVILYDNFYSIEWQNNAMLTAEKFILEKSTEGTTFSEIFETQAEDDNEKTYYYSDPKDFSNELIYYRIRQVNKDGSIVYSSSVKIGQGELKVFVLGQNYPNPFNPETTISVEMLETIETEIAVFDLVGRKITKLYDGILTQGVHTFTFNASDLPSGIYFYEIKTPVSSEVRKMILAK
jgi:hypothetical protein